jgi:serine/threonine protein kinase
VRLTVATSGMFPLIKKGKNDYSFPIDVYSFGMMIIFCLFVSLFPGFRR